MSEINYLNYKGATYDIAPKDGGVSRTKLSQELQNTITRLQSISNGPLVADKVSAMTDTTKVYVYTGNQTGYTNGNWYYYDGIAWISGGVYNSTALDTDQTLNISGAAADAKITGDKITQLKEDLSGISNYDSVIISSGSFVKLSGYFRSTGTISADENTKTLYFGCLPNAVYTINKILSARFRIGYTTVVPAVGVTVYGFKEDNNATSLKLTTGDDAHYVVVYYYDGNNDTLTEAEIFSSIRITDKVNITAIDRVARAEISQIEPGLSDEAKTALLNCLAHVAWVDENGQDYYDALEVALHESDYPRITAVFSQGSHVVYTDDYLNSIKPYLTVTYYESAESSGTTVPSGRYTLSGSLVAGTSDITVVYNSYSYKITVTVTQSPVVGLNKTGVGLYGGSNNYCLVTPRDLRGAIVTQSNFEKLKTKTASEEGTSGVSDYCPFRIPENAVNIVYRFGSSGWSKVSILTLNESTGIYTKVDEIGNGNFTGGTDLTVSMTSYNNGNYFAVPFANNSEQDPTQVQCYFTFE